MSGRDHLVPRGWLSVLGLVSPGPNTTEPWDLLVVSLSIHFAGPGIREVAGQKQEQAIMSTAPTESTKQRNLAYFKLTDKCSRTKQPEHKGISAQGATKPLGSSGNPTTRA